MNIDDEIYVIKDTDPLGGNANSIDNLPHRQLDDKIRNVAGEVGLLREQVSQVEESADARARVFYTQPVGPYSRGDLWIDDGILYQSQADRGTGEYVDDDWLWCIRSNITTYIESTNGDQFRRGQVETTMIAHCFRNGIEITSELSPTQFNWRRSSQDPVGDYAWNQAHRGLGASILITVADIAVRATIFVDLVEA